MAISKLVKKINKFNHGRDPELLQLKYKRMKSNAFAFLRGSCHLFYEDWIDDSSLNDAPLSWICGDLHLENFGSYRGDNRLTYFDINDFDEAVLAPCTLDLTRLLTSVFLAFPEKHYLSPEHESLGHLFLGAYTKALKEGKARWLERDLAEGLVKTLLDKVQNTQRDKFLDKRTSLTENHRQILIQEDKTRPISETMQQTIKESIKAFAEAQENPEFFKVLDIVWRIAGTGSLGLQRYMVLVEGKGSPNHNYLLDIKLANPPSLPHYLDFPQPQWETEAQRIIAIQQRMQAISPASVHSLRIEGKPFVMREYQPKENKIDLFSNELDLKSLKQLLESLGQLVAWAQLRSVSRQGSASADDLIHFSGRKKWHKKVLKYAQQYSQEVEANWKEFCQEI